MYATQSAIRRHAGKGDSRESYLGIVTESILRQEPGLAAPVTIRPPPSSSRSIAHFSAWNEGV